MPSSQTGRQNQKLARQHGVPQAVEDYLRPAAVKVGVLKEGLTLRMKLMFVVYIIYTTR
jgi:hypothetical protein